MDKQKSILVVDDDESTCRTLKLVLDRKGYQTETAGSGREALEKTQEQFYNLVLLDIKLPDMQGTELIAPLKKLHPEMTVIMVTAFASLESAVQALKEGALGYITKPLDIDEVLASAEIALNRQRLVMEKRRAEEALRESEALFRATIGSTADGILVVNDEGQVIHANSRFAEMWHMPEAIIETTSLQELLNHVLDQLVKPRLFLSKVRQLAGTSIADSDTLAFRDGRVFELYSCPLIQDDRLIAHVWSFRNITELKRAEESAMLYLDLMSHDIRNGLQGILMNTEMLQLPVDDLNVASTLTEIEASVHKCADLISKVKTTEHLFRTQLVDKSLNNALAESVKSFTAMFSGITVKLDMGNVEATIRADGFLDTLLMNILENSVRHNPREEKRLWVSLQKRNLGYEVSIADNGPGLTDDRKRDLFDKSRRFGGVGLHLIAQIVEKYGGSVDVFDRVPGDSSEGADFRVWFPRP